jgi:hypothetical protein
MTEKFATLLGPECCGKRMSTVIFFAIVLANKWESHDSVLTSEALLSRAEVSRTDLTDLQEV